MDRLLLLSIISLFLYGSDAQTIELKPGDATRAVTIGSGLMIKCEAKGLGQGEDPQLTWTSAQGSVIQSEDSLETVHVEGKGTQVLKLFIRTVANVHAGKWICSGILGGQPQQKDVIFDVWKDISFNGSQNQRGAIYTDHLIQCEVGGSPQPYVYWTFKGKQLNSGRYIPKPKGLKILNITKKDEGAYDCNAEIESRARYETHRINFVVMIPPKLTSPPKMTSGIEGRELIMYCKADGDPPPKYEWYKRDNQNTFVRVNDGGRYEISDVEGMMKIKSLITTDEGEYKCRAHNPAGDVEGIAKVDVLVPPKIIKADSGEGVENGEMTMLCVATGRPAPEMQWHKVGNPGPFQVGQPDPTASRVTIRQDKQDGRSTIEMTITGLQASDISNYTCIATNEAGNDTTRRMLNVLFKPQFTNTPSDTAYAWTGSAGRNISCIVDSNPHARVSWLRNNIPISNNGTFTIHEVKKERQVVSNLSVVVDFTNQAWMFGEYVCEGSNNQGSDKKVITLKKAELPHPPSVVDIARDSQRWLQIRIVRPSKDGGMPITGYRVKYLPPGGQNDITIDKEIEKERIRDDEATPATVVDIDNLEPSTSYVFRVQAITEVGYSTPKEVPFTTRQISQPEPVRVTSEKYSQNPTEYRLAWDKPRDGGSPILHYIIRYRHVTVNETNDDVLDLKGDFRVVKLEEPEATSYLITNLVPNRTYQIEIQVVNSVGPSQKRYKIVTTKNGPKPGGDKAVMEDGGMSTGAIVGLVIIIFLILLLIVDVTCYFKNHCGILMCIRENICAKPAVERDRQVTVEEGDDKETQPLAEKTKEDVESKDTGADNRADTVEDEKKHPLLDGEGRDGPDITGHEIMEPDKMEEKEPEDKDDRIEETPVVEGKEAKEDPPVDAPAQGEEITEESNVRTAPQSEEC